MSWRMIGADCLDALAEMPEASVDAVVTDPPYGLSAEPDAAEVLRHWLAGDDYQHRGGGFMGKTWDSFVPGPKVWAECHRVLKPGGHLVAFFGTRTYDLGAIAIRLAGFEVRDCLAWMYGSGFPKSLDVSKAIDKAAGAEREVVGVRENVNVYEGRHAFGESQQGEEYVKSPITAPATPAAQQWQGWGTALKPAHEPIILARKPLTGTVAANVQEFGTGALNVDGCRVAGPKGDGVWGTSNAGVNRDRKFNASPEMADYRTEQHPSGRWPANVILDEEAGAMLDDRTGREVSRFFYCPKASKAERNAGLDGFAVKRPDERDKTGMGTFDEKGVQPQRNAHPTVKPIDLMRYLCRLVTPSGGVVLDPFTGSGTTGIAAGLEGFDFIGIEREAEYLSIAEARLGWWADHGDSAEEPPTLWGAAA